MQQRQRFQIGRRAILVFGLTIPLIVSTYILASRQMAQEQAPPIVTTTFTTGLRGTSHPPAGETGTPSPTTTPASLQPTLTDFWNGMAEWVLDVPDTGLPVGESDTLYRGGGVYWSYLHASTQSAGIVDSCGDPVEFPGCVTRWVSTDDGRTFTPAENECLLACDTCPCDANDRTWQQQYPRVTRAPGGAYLMVFEHGAAVMLSRSTNGLAWSRPSFIPYTGVWRLDEHDCADYMLIFDHPFYPKGEDDCFAGGPPGLVTGGGNLYVFMGLGQNPGHMGCYRTPLWNLYTFAPCRANPLFDGVLEYGPIEAQGRAADPYFDFRYITSADVVQVGGMYYMFYEGIRGPSNPVIGRDNQFALGLARAASPDGPWEEFPGNPILNDVLDNWGIGHADVVIVNGVTYLYTATPELNRARYILRFR